MTRLTIVDAVSMTEKVARSKRRKVGIADGSDRTRVRAEMVSKK